jgi:hypothetical protein
MNDRKLITLPGLLATGLIVSYFVIGLFIAPHYGINWDDTDQHQNGINNWNFITHTDRWTLTASDDKYHGPAFELLLVAIEKSLHLTDMHDIYLVRHCCVFLFFCTVLIAFFLFCRSIFESPWAGLLGISMLLFSPRIFAESFYNPKDIVFMGAMIWAMYSLLVFSGSVSYRHALFHAFICAFAVDVRVIGILLIPVSVALIAYYIYAGKLRGREVLPRIVFFFIAFAVFMVCMWPILTLHPAREFWLALKQMSNYVVWDSKNIYMGGHYPSDYTPWHYHWVWMLVTLPEAYIVLVLSGLFLFVSRMIRHSFATPQKNAFLLISIFFFLFPLIARSLTQSIVYDAWRHVYFVYPFALILAVYGIQELSYVPKKVYYYFALSIAIIGMADALVMIITMHPYEYVYFNHTANTLFKPIDQKFEMDYWGVSYKQGLEYLLKQDTGKIKVCFGNKPGSLNYLCLKPEQRGRFEMIRDHDSTKYYITNYRDHWIPPPSYTPYTIRAQGNVVLGVYKLR